MIKFERYSHINDLFEHYIKAFDDEVMAKLMESGVTSEDDAIVLSTFVWKMVEQINEDEENGNIVLGGADNTEMLPDLNYEISQYMKQVGFHSTWERISRSNFSC
jgi:predicted transcriptional regulator